LVECESLKDQGFIDTFVKKKRKRKYVEHFDIESKVSNVGQSTPQKIKQSKCSFSPKSFYKTSTTSKADLNKEFILNRSSLKYNEPTLNSTRLSAKGLTSSSTVKSSSVTTKKNLPSFKENCQKVSKNTKVIPILKPGLKLNNSALLKTSKLPQICAKDSQRQAKKASRKSANKSCCRNSSIRSFNDSANNEMLNSVTESLISTRVSPVKSNSSSPESSRSVWNRGTKFETSKLNKSTSNVSPSKILRPPVLNVVTSPPKQVIKQVNKKNTLKMNFNLYPYLKKSQYCESLLLIILILILYV